jgi:hypothetical protein
VVLGPRGQAGAHRWLGPRSTSKRRRQLRATFLLHADQQVQAGGAQRRTTMVGTRGCGGGPSTEAEEARLAGRWGGPPPHRQARAYVPPTAWIRGALARRARSFAAASSDGLFGPTRSLSRLGPTADWIRRCRSVQSSPDRAGMSGRPMDRSIDRTSRRRGLGYSHLLESGPHGARGGRCDVTTAVDSWSHVKQERFAFHWI